MKKVFSIFVALSFLLLISCSSLEPFTMTDDGHIRASDGTEYVFLANEGFVYTFGSEHFLGKIEGEKSSFIHFTSILKTGLYSCEKDPDKRTLVRIVPDCEWRAYYRKASLPMIDISPDNCIRFELIEGSGYDVDISHMTCNVGIISKNKITDFLSDIRSQKTAREARLYDLVKMPNGMLDNCYELGIVYGYFEGEPNLAIPLHVTSFNDKAYSIYIGKEYVLPEKWLSELVKTNP